MATGAPSASLMMREGFFFSSLMLTEARAKIRSINDLFDNLICGLNIGHISRHGKNLCGDRIPVNRSDKRLGVIRHIE